MPIMEWSEQLDIGVEKMNDDHKDILKYMNLLFDRSKEGAGKVELVGILQRLVDVTVKHFKEEEVFMQSIQYDQLSLHQIIHKKLLNQLAEHQKKFEAGDGSIPAGFFDFLKMWLSAHIQGIDTRYGEVAKSLGRAG